jgi:hypothetical protein
MSCWKSSCATKLGATAYRAKAWLQSWSCSPRKNPKTRGADAGKAAGGIELLGKTAVVEQDPQAQMVAGYRRKLSMALN